MADKNLSAAERKKKALRDNLKRRKSQIRELKSDSDAELKIRKDALVPKSTTQINDVEDGSGA